MQEIDSQKKHTLRFAAANKQTWLFIKQGKKTIETRAGTTKYKKVKQGDILILCCAGDKIEKKVKNVAQFKTVAALIKKYNPDSINPGAKNLADMQAMYYSYPGYKEKIQTFGILAFELE